MAPAPLPVVIVETTAQAQSRQESEAESAEHERLDLEAQEKAADAAEAQVLPNRVGTALTVVGTLALFCTLLLTQQSLNLSRRTTVAELRAYLSVTMDTWRGSLSSSPTKLGVRCKMVNHGSTPAKKVVLKRAVRLLPFPLVEPLPDVDTGPHQILNIWPHAPLDGGWAEADRPFTDAELAIAMDDASGQRIYVFGSVTYQDVFDVERRSDFCVYADPLSYEAGPPEMVIWAVYPGHNDFT